MVRGPSARGTRTAREPRVLAAHECGGSVIGPVSAGERVVPQFRTLGQSPQQRQREREGGARNRNNQKSPPSRAEQASRSRRSGDVRDGGRGDPPALPSSASSAPRSGRGRGAHRREGNVTRERAHAASPLVQRRRSTGAGASRGAGAAPSRGPRARQTGSLCCLGGCRQRTAQNNNTPLII